MNSWHEFLEMGGYAGFVWPSYIAVALVLIVLMYLSIRSLKAAEADLQSLEASDQHPNTLSDQHPSGGAPQP